MTSIGILWIAVTIFALFFSLRYLVILLVFSAFLQAAAVVNFGGKGVTPFLTTELIFLLKVLGLGFHTRFPKWCLWAGLLLAYVIISALLFPVVFSGVEVFVPNKGIDWSVMHGGDPLEFRIGNIVQPIYLAINIAVLLAVYAVRHRVSAETWYRALLVSTILVSLIGLWEFIAGLGLVGFPKSFFYSNQGYAQLADQVVHGVNRLNSTFTEPSYAGAVLGAAFWMCVVYMFSRGKKNRNGFIASAHQRNRFKFTNFDLESRFEASHNENQRSSVQIVGRDWIVFPASLLNWSIVLLLFVAWMLTLSGTGVAALLGGFACAMIFVRARVMVVFMILAGVVSLAGYFSLASFASEISEAILHLIFKKLESQSAFVRFKSDKETFRIIGETLGLGVGLGSHRPSSMAAYLLANVGIVGLFLYAVFMFRVVADNLRNAGLNACREKYVKSTVVFLLTLLVAQLVSVPDLSFSVTWVALFVLVGVGASRCSVVGYREQARKTALM